jgi:hypothetical protein
MRNAVLMVRTSSELSRGGDFSVRSLTDFVVLVISALLSSDAAAFEGSAMPSRIKAALLSSGAASSDGSVTPLWTNLSRGGNLRVFFFSALLEELRDWVLSDLDFGPPLAALGGMVVNVLMWMRFHPCCGSGCECEHQS